MTLAAVLIDAVIGMKDELKGEAPCGFIVLNRPPTEIEKEIVALLREKIGPVAAFKIAITVARLPKRRSGKILRGTMKKTADGDQWTMPATIDDPAILGEIGSALKGARNRGIVLTLGLTLSVTQRSLKNGLTQSLDSERRFC